MDVTVTEVLTLLNDLDEKLEEITDVELGREAIHHARAAFGDATPSALRDALDDRERRWEERCVYQKALQRREEEVAALKASAQILGSAADLETTLKEILNTALQVTGARFGILRLVDASGTKLVTGALAGEGLERPIVEELDLEPTTITGWVAVNRKPALVRDTDELPWKDLYYPLDRVVTMRSELAVPLIGRSNRLEGVLNLESPRPHAFLERDQRLLIALGTHASLAIENSRHQDELKTALEQKAVAEMFAAVGDVAAHLLQSLNQKVGGIPERIKAIKKGIPGPSDLLRSLDEVQKSAEEAMDVVRDNIRLMRPQPSRPVRLDECVQEALRRTHLPVATRVRTHGLDSVPPVVGDEHSITLIFVNLMENAASAMEGRGLISVTANRVDGRTVVAVEDTGPGIPLERQNRIFEFSYSGRGRLGIGLWWVRTVMTRMGGSITVASDGHKGSVFCLSFP